jgi:hypothetical protein
MLNNPEDHERRLSSFEWRMQRVEEALVQINHLTERLEVWKREVVEWRGETKSDLTWLKKMAYASTIEIAAAALTFLVLRILGVL